MKKVLSLFLAIVMCISLGTVSAFAYASNDPNYPTELTIGVPFTSNVYYSNPGDYYSFYLPQKSDVTITAGALPIYHDYTMNLWGWLTPDDPIDISTSDKYGDYLEIEATLEAGTYYIDLTKGKARIEPDECFYQMLVEAEPIVEPDRYEPNNTPATAVQLGKINSWSVDDATLHKATDVDYYAFTVDELSSISVGLFNIPEGCSYKIDCLRKSSSGSYGSVGNEDLSDTSLLAWLDPGEYVIKVSSLSGYSASPYHVGMTIAPLIH